MENYTASSTQNTVSKTDDWATQTPPKGWEGYRLWLLK